MAKTKKSEENAVEKAVEETEEAMEKVEKTAKKITKKIKEAEEKMADAVENEIVKDMTAGQDDPAKEKKKSKLEELKEKAAKLAGKVEDVKEITASEVRKKKDKEEQEEKKDMLVPIEDYLKSSIHLGTRVITPDMRSYVYRRRADGLAVFNTSLLDDKLKEGAEYLAKFAPQDIIIVCKREAGWKAVQKFAELTGIRVYTKKYPSGILTNTNLENFIETELVFICDPWLDKNALMDANRVGSQVLSVCDTNNFTQGINQIIPGNNKSAKSLGMIFYLLTKIYTEKRKINVSLPSIQEFIDGWDDLQAPK